MTAKESESGTGARGSDHDYMLSGSDYWEWQSKCYTVTQRASHILKMEEWTDCSFLFGEEEEAKTLVKAHKFMLAMSSPVFNAMFYGPLAEKDAPIRITDVKPAVFKAMLEYIYTDNMGTVTSVDSSMAYDLIYVAQKYMLPQMMTCEKFVNDIFTAETVCPVFDYALMIKEDQLISKCKEVIKRQPTRVLTTSEFLQLSVDAVATIFSWDWFYSRNEFDLIQAADDYNKALKARSENNEMTSPVNSLKRPMETQNALVPLHTPAKIFKGNNNGHDEAANETANEQSVTSTHAGESIDKKKAEPAERPMRKVVSQIRFLKLTPEQLVAEKSLASLLTGEELAAILCNAIALKNNKSSRNTRLEASSMPDGFSTKRD